MSSSFEKGYKIGEATAAVIFEGIPALFRTLWYLLSLLRPSMRARRISKHREMRETRALYREVESLFNSSPIKEMGPIEFIGELVLALCERLEHELPEPAVEALSEATMGLMIEEGLWDLLEIDWSRDVSVEQGVELRKYLNAQKRFLSNYDQYIGIWREAVLCIYQALLAHLPAAVTLDQDSADAVSFTVPLIELLEDGAPRIDRLIITVFDEKILNARLFETLRERLHIHAMVASGLDPENPKNFDKRVRFPSETAGKTPTELAELYLGGTPFGKLLLFPCALTIPENARFEHCHIVGGTGHGKTELLKLLIHEDLKQAQRSRRAVCVIDSGGDLLGTISHLAYFSPDADGGLSDKLVLIDPNDTEYPVALNMFDMNLERLAKLSGAARERMTNAIIELYEYMFGALLGAELTQRQGLIFKYLAQLMMVIPGATVHTLRALMEDSTPFRPYVEKLEGTARAFFETQFFSPQFGPTKKQILTRLWGVLSNRTLERMFSHERNKVDLFSAMQDGNIVLINTARDLLQKDGCQILGRFFIALITQATLQRAAIAPEERSPCFVYVDEAHEYFDEHIEDLINQARKYRVGLTLAHQNLDQLNTTLRASVLASTSVKIVGGVSAKDADVCAKDMHATPEFIQHTKKRAMHTEFACWIKHVTPNPVHLSVPLGAVDRLPVMDEARYLAVIQENRARYCEHIREQKDTWTRESAVSEGVAAPSDSTPSPAPSQPRGEGAAVAGSGNVDVPEPPRRRAQAMPHRDRALGRGGTEHTYLQGLIKRVAEERGFRAIIEKEIAGGAGSVDVSLERGSQNIACEISVTTSPEHEVKNIIKCLDVGYETVTLVASEFKRMRKLKEYATQALSSEQMEKTHVFLPEDFIAYLEEEDAEAAGSNTTVKGYTVKVRYSPVNETERKNRRQAIAKVILQSMKRMGKTQ